MSYIFSGMAEILDWAKRKYPNASISITYLEDDRYVLSIKGKGQVQREVVYVRKEEESGGT